MSREKLKLSDRRSFKLILTVVHKKWEGDVMTVTNAEKVLGRKRASQSENLHAIAVRCQLLGVVT